MNILFVAPYVPSLIRVRPYHFIRELSRRGHSVTVLAATHGDPGPDADALREYCARLEVVSISPLPSVRSCAVAALRGDPLQAGVSHSPILDQRLHQLLGESAFDVVHVEHLRAARLVDLLPPSMPRIYDAVDSISLLLERTLRSSHSLRQRLIARIELARTRAFEGRTLRRFDLTIVTAPDDAAMLQQFAPSASIAVVPNGVDQDYFKPVEEQREPATLVFSGKMSYHANVTAVLHFVRDIFPAIKQARPDVRFLVVGSGPPRAVQDLGRDPSIQVTGHVPDVRPYIGRATIAVCPMVVKVGIQNKLLEAMAMAIPTVASRAAATGLSAEPGQDFLVADSPTEFARSVCALLENPERARAIGLAGKSYVEQYHSWSKAGKRLEDFYGEAICARTNASKSIASS